MLKIKLKNEKDEDELTNILNRIMRNEIEYRIRGIGFISEGDRTRIIKLLGTIENVTYVPSKKQRYTKEEKFLEDFKRSVEKLEKKGDFP